MISFDLSKQEFSGAKVTTLLTTLASKPRDEPLSQFTLESFAVYIAQVSK
jgi:hypothetical protein